MAFQPPLVMSVITPAAFQVLKNEMLTRLKINTEIEELACQTQAGSQNNQAYNYMYCLKNINAVGKLENLS